MPTYLWTDLQSAVEANLHNRQAGLVGTNYSESVMINGGVRDVLSDMDLRSTKRRAATAPNLFNDIWQYACPTDLKKKKIIGLQPQTMERSRYQIYNLIPEENFDQLKQTKKNLISINDRDMVRSLLVSADNINDKTLVVSPLDALTGSGSWTGFGDGTNLSVDTYNYIKGNASIKWDISSAGGTTAGIQATDIPTFDLTNYYSNGSVFVWAFITSATNITNFKCRVGNDSSNYYEMTVTVTNEGAAFVAGWNLLRFDFSGKSTVGTVSLTTCDYAVIYMTKSAGKISETDYRFDHIILKLGAIYNLIYYSKYLWQNSGGAWIENSTATTDKLNIDTDEFEIIVEKCTERCARALPNHDDEMMIAANNYKDKKASYQKQYKSEALLETTDYQYF